jgi:putative membrane protein
MLMGAIQLLGVLPIGSICIYRIVTLALNARSWQVLLPPSRPGFPTLLRLRWIGESVNTLLPVAQVGGDLARASLVSSRGVARADAAASMMADLATGLVTQMLFGLAGALALAQLLPPEHVGHRVLIKVVAGLTAFTLAVVALSILFHMGAARLAARFLAGSKVHESWARLVGSLSRVDLAVTALLARERAVASSFVWHMGGWVSQVGETWLLFKLFGANVPLVTAFAIESMTSAARGAAFFVPSGVGVQEMTLLSMAKLTGIDMELALALGIAKRARELVLGVPGLVAWAADKKWWRSWTSKNGGSNGSNGRTTSDE